MNKHSLGLVAVTIVVAIAAFIYWNTRHAQPDAPVGVESNPSSTQTKPQPSKPASSDRTATETPETEPSEPNRAKPQSQTPSTTQTESRPEPTAPPEPVISPIQAYCEGDRQSIDIAALRRVGGLVGILQKEASLSDVYGCAESYLANGGDIDRADSRADSDRLTPLLFAIQRNDPKMVRFMIDHGADLSQRGGRKDIKPYGYAVFSALQNRSTDYNEVIGILDQSLEKTGDAGR